MSSPPSRLGLTAIDTFVLSAPILAQTLAFLRKVGASKLEGFVLWGGLIESSTTFRFTRALIPEQEAFQTEEGLLVVVRGDALFRVNKELNECGEVLGAQIHSHPTSAYHSDTDDHYPLVTLSGALSIVVPDFARNAPEDMARWAWYRLAQYGQWTPLNNNDTKVVIS